MGCLRFLDLFDDGKVEEKDVVNKGAVALSCLLNYLWVNLLGFSSFCLTLSSVGGVHFV